MMMGKPYWSVNSLTSSKRATAPGVPGTTGTPAAMASFRADTLSPSASITPGLGPTNCSHRRVSRIRQPLESAKGLAVLTISPAASTLRANSAFSDRKP